MTVKVITDSTCDLPPALAEQLGITVVPANVHFGEEVYRDGVEITGDEFYRRLVASSRLPTTSQPTPGDFLSAYDEIGQTANEIISVHVSAKLSGTLNSAAQAREEYGGDCRIEIIDSLQGSMGLGMLVIAAAEAANRGDSLDEVLTKTRAALPNVGFMGLLDTLEYLQKGGRIGKAQAFMGSLLKIKPLLTIRDGEAHPLERARTRAKGVDRMCELVQEMMPLNDLAVVYTTTPDEARALAQRLQTFLPQGEVKLSQVGPAVGTYLGPGVLGVAHRKQSGGVA